MEIKSRRKPFKLENLIFLNTYAVVLLIVVLISALSSFFYSRSVSNVAYENALNISNQIISNYHTYSTKIIDEALYVEKNLMEYSGVSNAHNLFENMVESREDLISISFVDSKLDTIVSYPKNTSKLNYDFLEDVSNSESYYQFSTPFVYDQTTNKTCISVAKKFMYLNTLNGNWHEGLINLNYSFDLIKDIASLSSTSDIFFFDDEGTLIYASDNNESETNFALEVLNTVIIGDKNVNFESNHYVAVVDTIDHTRWNLVILNDISTYYNYIYNFYEIVVSIALSALVIAFVVANLVARRILKPIKEVSRAIKEVRAGNLDARVDMSKVYYQKTALGLGTAFNTMINQINNLMDKIVKEQEANRIAEVKALQNQINPHFLYNTLNSIAYLAETNQNEDVVKMVESLASFFRISISKGRQIITVKEEVKHVESYLIIQKIRYKEAFNYKFNIDENILDADSMKLILQPFVENCINHGLKGMIDEGMIIINGYRRDDMIVFEVIDNGLGMVQEEVDELNKSIKDPESYRGVGMKNVYQRLIIYYKGNASLFIESKPDVGTKVTIELPYERTQIPEENKDEKDS